LNGNRTPEVFRPPATAFPIFVQLTCIGEEYHLWAQQIVESLDGFDAARAALHERAKSLLRSHECNAESYTYSWTIFDDRIAVKWARHLFGAAAAESFILARPPATRTDDEYARPFAASPATHVPPMTVSPAELESPGVEGLANRLCFAAISYNMGVTYQTTERNMKHLGTQLGTNWRLLALVSLNDWLPVMSDPTEEAQ